MRKGMWKKGLTVAMAAAMLAGPVSVPAVFNNGVSVVKADVAEIVKTVESQNTADVSKFSSDAINKISANIDKIEAATNVKINYISADNTLQIKDANGTSLIEAKVGQSTNLVQTGTSYVPYIVVSGIALIAVAVLVAKKVTSK